MNYISKHDSPLGEITFVANDSALLGVYINEHSPLNSAGCYEHNSIIETAKKQLDEYFACKRTIFELPLHSYGSIFQKKVWQALCDIPYGTTISYKMLAERIGNKKACRAVGLANSRNPHSIIVPCHRVIASDGKLSGYAGGVTIKSWLLQHENALESSQKSAFFM